MPPPCSLLLARVPAALSPRAVPAMPQNGAVTVSLRPSGPRAAALCTARLGLWGGVCGVAAVRSASLLGAVPRRAVPAMPPLQPTGVRLRRRKKAAAVRPVGVEMREGEGRRWYRDIILENSRNF